MRTKGRLVVDYSIFSCVCHGQSHRRFLWIKRRSVKNATTTAVDEASATGTTLYLCSSDCDHPDDRGNHYITFPHHLNHGCTLPSSPSFPPPTDRERTPSPSQASRGYPSQFQRAIHLQCAPATRSTAIPCFLPCGADARASLLCILFIQFRRSAVGKDIRRIVNNDNGDRSSWCG